MNQIVKHYTDEKLFIPNAVMLIIKPVKVNNINIEDYFIDWNPGLLRLAIVIEVYQKVCFYASVTKRYLSS